MTRSRSTMTDRRQATAVDAASQGTDHPQKPGYRRGPSPFTDAKGRPGGTPGRPLLLRFVFERDVDTGSECRHLAVVDRHVELLDLRHTEITEGLGGRLHGVLDRVLPARLAGTDQLGHPINARLGGHGPSPALGVGGPDRRARCAPRTAGTARCKPHVTAQPDYATTPAVPRVRHVLACALARAP